MLLKTILCTTTFLVINLITNNLELANIGLIISAIIVLITYDYINVKKYNIVDKKFSMEIIIKLFKVGFNAFAFTFLTLYIINASRYIIDNTLSSTNQAIYGILIMPATVLILVSQFIMQPFLNNIKRLLQEENIQKLKKLVWKLCGAVLIIGMICIILAWFLGIPVLEYIYGINLINYKNDLIIIMIGSILYGIISIISAVLTAMRKTKIQLIIFIIASIITFIVSINLITQYKILGASITYLISMVILFTLYNITYINIINKKRKES